MKHRIVGDHHQVIAFELASGEELLVINGKLIFAKGSAVVREGASVKAGSGLPDAALLQSPGGWGMAGIIPIEGGHIKRVDISPPSGLVAACGSVFILSRGVVTKSYEPPPDAAPALADAPLVSLTGAGAAFIRTQENFIEFTLGAEEELRADASHIVAFTGGMKIKAALNSAGGMMVTLGGPGNIIIASAP
jgi:uncharacterized protein (AIM24 family)